MISVVIPALNECNGIVETIDRAKAALNGAQLTPYEIVVVDDGSADGTGALAEQAGAKVVRHPHNIGYGRSLKDGIRAASYDTIVVAWILPNVLRSFCLNFMSSNMHYFGDVTSHVYAVEVASAAQGPKGTGTR